MEEGRPVLPVDRYLLADLLGEGGMAKVWRAWHFERGGWCAIKVLSTKYAQQPEARRRFLDEGRTLTRLQHRNVIQAWEAVDAEPQPYIVMEVADAGAIHDWVRKHGAMTPRMAVEVAVQICKGLGAAHRIGVIHRDVKPHNVLVNRKGTCKISDFGIARLDRSADASTLPNATTHHEAMGTLGYMAPEQRSHPQHADARIDVYGVGATLYTLLTGRVITNLFKAIEEDPETLKDIPGVLVPVLAKATAYRPEARHATIHELARELHAVWSQLPDDARRPPPLTVDVKPEPPPPPGVVAQGPASLPPTSLAEELRAGPSLDDLDTGIHRPPPITPPPLASLPPGRRYPATTAPPPELRFRSQGSEGESTTRPRTRPLIVIAAVVGILGMVLSGPTIYVRLAARDAVVAQRAFAQVVFDELPVIDDVGRHGADRRSLEARVQELREAPDLATALAAADRYLAELERARAAATDAPERTTLLVENRIRQIAVARDAWHLAIERWRQRSEGFPGVIATTLHLAPAPPELPPR